MDESNGYEYPLEEIRKLYAHMPRAYLDNSAAPLYLRTIAERSAEALCKHQFGNPHSHGVLGERTSKLVNGVRSRILDLLNADPNEYAVVFTANATAAARLVGDAASDLHFAYSIDSHTSIVGIRELCGSFEAVKSFDNFSHWQDADLVSWPMQSNFDGTVYPSDRWLEYSGSCRVLLDAASWCSTSPLDLRKLKPDFVPLSFYKMFGLPDLGALILRQDAISFMRRRKYFGGGTVASLAPRSDFMVRRPRIEEMLEDGTLPVHTIAVLDVAITEFLKVYGSFQAVATHTRFVAGQCWEQLRSIPGVTIVSSNPQTNGPIVTFSLDNCGANEFAIAAAAADIHVRAGTLCNIGAFALLSRLGDAEIEYNYRKHGKTCNDNIDTIRNQTMGVVRASFGPYSSLVEVNELVNFIRSICLGNTYRAVNDAATSAVVHQLVIYPIKSCAGLLVERSRVFENGLEHDREFCLVSTGVDPGRVLSLKRNLQMCLIKSYFQDRNLIITTPQGTISIPVDYTEWHSSREIEGKGCECSYIVTNCDPKLQQILSKTVGTPCTLGKLSGNRFFKHNGDTFVNESPVLLVSTTSAAALKCDWRVFRANIVISALHSWAEDSWRAIDIGDSSFELLGKCRRCNMVCVNSEGKSDPHPYHQLCKHRKIDGRIWFGQHMQLKQGITQAEVAVGDLVSAVLS